MAPNPNNPSVSLLTRIGTPFAYVGNVLWFTSFRPQTKENLEKTRFDSLGRFLNNSFNITFLAAHAALAGRTETERSRYLQENHKVSPTKSTFAAAALTLAATSGMAAEQRSKEAATKLQKSQAPKDSKNNPLNFGIATNVPAAYFTAAIGIATFGNEMVKSLYKKANSNIAKMAVRVLAGTLNLLTCRAAAFTIASIGVAFMPITYPIDGVIKSVEALVKTLQKRNERRREAYANNDQNIEMQEKESEALLLKKRKEREAQEAEASEEASLEEAAIEEAAAEAMKSKHAKIKTAALSLEVPKDLRARANSGESMGSRRSSATGDSGYGSDNVTDVGNERQASYLPEPVPPSPKMTPFVKEAIGYLAATQAKSATKNKPAAKKTEKGIKEKPAVTHNSAKKAATIINQKRESLAPLADAQSKMDAIQKTQDNIQARAAELKLLIEINTLEREKLGLRYESVMQQYHTAKRAGSPAHKQLHIESTELSANIAKLDMEKNKLFTEIERHKKTLGENGDALKDVARDLERNKENMNTSYDDKSSSIKTRRALSNKPSPLDGHH